MVEQTLEQKINSRMDKLQEMMDANLHLDDPQAVKDHIHTVSKFWPRLHEDDRDYIQCAQGCIDDGTPWGFGPDGAA